MYALPSPAPPLLQYENKLPQAGFQGRELEQGLLSSIDATALAGAQGRRQAGRHIWPAHVAATACCRAAVVWHSNPMGACNAPHSQQLAAVGCIWFYKRIGEIRRGIDKVQRMETDRRDGDGRNTHSRGNRSCISLAMTEGGGSGCQGTKQSGMQMQVAA